MWKLRKSYMSFCGTWGVSGREFLCDREREPMCERGCDFSRKRESLRERMRDYKGKIII